MSCDGDALDPDGRVDFTAVLNRHLRVLAVDIGPRGSGTAQEARAADYIEGVLRDNVGTARRETFSTPAAYAWAYLIFYGLGALAAVLTLVGAAGSGGDGLLIAAAVVGLAAFVLFYRENTTAGTLGGLFRRYPSQNVLSVLEPRQGGVTAAVDSSGADSSGRDPSGGDPFPSAVVLVAHYDSAKWGLMFDPAGVHRFRALFLGGVASLLAVPLLAVAALVLHRASGWGALVPAVWLLVSCGLLLHREVVGTYTHGANDNGSGTAALLALAEHFSHRPTRRLPIWFVATGCEEVGLVGMMDFLRRHGQELRDAAFFVLDNFGAGIPKYAVTEGMLRSHPLDPELTALAAQVAAEHPEWGVRPGRNDIMPTDALPAVARGYRTIAFRAEDERGLLPNWHWPSDTLENVDLDTINSICRLMTAMIRRLDQ